MENKIVVNEASNVVVNDNVSKLLFKPTDTLTVVGFFIVYPDSIAVRGDVVRYFHLTPFLKGSGSSKRKSTVEFITNLLSRYKKDELNAIMKHYSEYLDEDRLNAVHASLKALGKTTNEICNDVIEAIKKSTNKPLNDSSRETIRSYVIGILCICSGIALALDNGEGSKNKPKGFLAELFDDSSDVVDVAACESPTENVGDKVVYVPDIA